MFWRFGFHNASAIDAILDKEGVKLDDIMGEDELIQEVKGQNIKLIEFLSRTENIKSLLGYITSTTLEESKAFKYPFVATEIIGCEIYSICEALMKNVDILNQFWDLLETPPPLNPLQASYFARVNIVLLSKKTTEMIAFLSSRTDPITSILHHIGNSSISDLILKLVNLDENADAAGVIKWLSSQKLVSRLFDHLAPHIDPEIHSNTAQTLMDIISVSFQHQIIDPATGYANTQDGPHQYQIGNLIIDEMKSHESVSKLISFMLDTDKPHSTSSLVNGINIIMELFRRYCSEFEQAEYQHHEYNIQVQSNRQTKILPTSQKILALATDLDSMFLELGQNLSKFTAILKNPKSGKGPIKSTYGTQFVLTSERLKICEMFAEVLHLQYLFTSSPLVELIVSATPIPEGPNDIVGIAAGLQFMSEKFAEEMIMPISINLFFDFPWNNFLHSVVYDMIAKALNTFLFTSNPGQGGKPSAELTILESYSDLTRAQMQSLRSSVKKLIITVLKDARLSEKIIEAQSLNDFEVQKPKGIRLGYMGHITYISDEICKIMEKCSFELPDIADIILTDSWHEYVAHSLKETQERDKKILGGKRPQVSLAQQHSFLEDEDIAKNNPQSVNTHHINDNSSNYQPVVEESEAYNDQLARYLTQQMVKDLPDRFAQIESSDEEDSSDWISKLEVKDIEFDIEEALSKENVDESSATSISSRPTILVESLEQKDGEGETSVD